MSDAASVGRLLAVAPQFTVTDVRRTAEYYRDVLGFEIAGYWDGERVTPDAGDGCVFGIVRRDHVEVFLSRSEAEGTGPVPMEGGCAAYFRVQGVDALAEEWRIRGAEILDGPDDRVYQQRELAIRDCNGLILVFGEDISRGP